MESQNQHDIFNTHKKLEEMPHSKRTIRWTEHMAELFNDNDRSDIILTSNKTGPAIT